MFNTIRVAIPVATVAGILANKTMVQNETKRRFYEDESQITPVPGTVIPALGTELEILGPNRIIDGISVRSPPSVENGFKTIRESVSSTYDSIRNDVNQGYTKINQTEKAVTKTVGDLHSRSEDLLPSSIYIVIAGLSGSIAAHRRGIIARVLLPIITGSIAFKYFLPKTFDNTTGFLWEAEKKNLPQLAASQERLVKEADDFAVQTEQTAVKSKQYVEHKSAVLRKSFADMTGLNIDEEVSKK